MNLYTWHFLARKCPKASQNQRLRHLLSTPIDQVNLIRTLVSYTEPFCSLTPKPYVDSHWGLILVEFYNQWQQHRWNAQMKKSIYKALDKHERYRGNMSCFEFCNCSCCDIDDNFDRILSTETNFGFSLSQISKSNIGWFTDETIAEHQLKLWNIRQQSGIYMLWHKRTTVPKMIVFTWHAYMLAKGASALDCGLIGKRKISAMKLLFTSPIFLAVIAKRNTSNSCS